MKPAERVIQSEVLLALSAAGHTVFRQNVGQGWAGKIVKQWTANGKRYITIEDPRPLRAGLCSGSSDVIGWTAEGRFLAAEVKSQTGRVSADQARFIAAVNRHGGLAGVVRSAAEALALVARRASRSRTE